MASIVNQGKLVPNDVIVNILSRCLEKSARKGESGFILDGFPRTTRQAVRISNLLFWGNESHCGFSILSCALYFQLLSVEWCHDDNIVCYRFLHCK